MSTVFFMGVNMPERPVVDAYITPCGPMVFVR